MAADHLKFRRHERSDKQRFMEHNFACALEEPKSVMKFSSQRLESPPSKPPRRRYSEQLSVTSLGTYSSNKKSNEENQRSGLKLKSYSPRPGYLSLPASLTSDALAKSDDTSNVHSHPFCLSDQLEYSRQDDFYAKSFDSLKDHESGAKQSYGYGSNRFFNNEKFQYFNAHSDQLLPNVHHENSTSCDVNRLSRNSINSNNSFMINAYKSQNLKSVHKECHRRHHSDPTISHFNLKNDNKIKFNHEGCCGNKEFSAEKLDVFCNSTGPCKKNCFVMQEIQNLKEINDMLWHHLCSLQTSLESMRKEVHSECTDISVSGLLSSIYYAQKTKDSALEGRVKLALEERDAAIHELEDLIHILSKHLGYADGEKKVDKDIKELLGEMVCITNPSKLLKYQRILLNHIHNQKESKPDCVPQKLRQTVIERDNALEKVKYLEEEIEKLKLCYDLWHSDNKHWECTMLDIISQIMHQRDSLYSKVDNGFDIGNVIHRPLATSKLDSIENQNVCSYEPRSKTIVSFKNYQSVYASDKQQHSNSASEEVMKLKEEILLLNKALDGERKKREHTEDKCFRLERLVHILRKKVNGQDVGVPV